MPTLKTDTLPDASLETLSRDCLARGVPERFAKNTLVMEQGVIPAKLYYILGGKIRLVEYSTDSDRLNVLDLEKDHFVCETRFLARLPLHFNIEAVTDASMVAFSRAAVEELLRDNENFRRCIFVNMAKKMQYLSRAYLDCAHEDNCSRVYKFLQTFNRKNGRDNRVCLTQQEIAEFLGIHRITVHRALHKLERQGRIALERKSIALC